MVDLSDPKLAYQQRLLACTQAHQRWLQRDGRLSNIRMAVVLFGAALLYAVFGAPGWPLETLIVPATVFSALVIWHERVVRLRDTAARRMRFYEEGLVRLSGDWAGKGKSGERFVVSVENHPYAMDVDVFGQGSLFERLCRAHTRGGEDRLAHYLLNTATVSDVRDRQAGVQELAPNVTLREELYVLANDIQGKVRPNTLLNWATLPTLLGSPLYLALFVACSLGSIASVVAWPLGYGPLAFVLMTFVVAAVTLRTQKSVTAIYSVLDEPGRELLVLADLLGRLEREAFTSPLLVGTQNALRQGDDAAQAIRRLGRLIELADARRNQFFIIPALYLLWSPIFAVLLERWRKLHGPHLQAWLDAISELEALSSLAGFAFESPTYVYPQLVDVGPHYEALELAHPLLGDEAVANDVTLTAPLQLLLVSGSNMSGKSTLLRSIGSSVVLAFAGAPVRAQKLVLSPLMLGATLRIQDSLLRGASRFYAEIQRLKTVVELLDDTLPVMFLLDEILHGTNSHDRRLGALAVVRSLVMRGAIGLVTTHDLALAELVGELAERARNVHFEDTLKDGKLHFDYRMRDGVVQKSNAIALMRAVGLPVPG